MAYQKLNWLNKGETGAIPINKTNLNHMDDGIEQNSNDIANIIESGSNDNGSWIKYSDGTMICSMSKNVYVNFSSSQKWGVMWESDNIDLGNFPQTFIEKPYVTISNFSESGGFIEILRDTTTSFVGNTKIARPSDTNGTIEYTLSIIAIGKWK